MTTAPRKTTTARAPGKSAARKAPTLPPNTALVPQRAYDTLQAAEAAIRQWEAVKAAARAEIEDALGDNELGVDAEGNELVSWKFTKANRLNQGKLKAAHPDLVAEFTELTESRRFVPVKRATTDEDE